MVGEGSIPIGQNYDVQPLGGVPLGKAAGKAGQTSQLPAIRAISQARQRSESQPPARRVDPSLYYDSKQAAPFDKKLQLLKKQRQKGSSGEIKRPTERKIPRGMEESPVGKSLRNFEKHLEKHVQSQKTCSSKNDKDVERLMQQKQYDPFKGKVRKRGSLPPLADKPVAPYKDQISHEAFQFEKDQAKIEKNIKQKTVQQIKTRQDIHAKTAMQLNEKVKKYEQELKSDASQLKKAEKQFEKASDKKTKEKLRKEVVRIKTSIEERETGISNLKQHQEQIKNETLIEINRLTENLNMQSQQKRV